MTVGIDYIAREGRSYQSPTPSAAGGCGSVSQSWSCRSSRPAMTPRQRDGSALERGGQGVLDDSGGTPGTYKLPRCSRT